MVHPNLLSDDERELLKEVLNRIIPASARMPAAGDIGVGDGVESATADAPADRRLFLEGLGAIDRAAWREHDQAFSAISSDERDALLQEVERQEPSFFDLLVRLTYRSYYSDPQVLTALGIDNRPPQPTGYQLPPFRPELLDVVRSRGPVYRKIDE
jgi:hypothetical protein